jgi:transcriptional regulator NrdR family protein
MLLICREQFINVVVNVLKRRGLEEDLARYIAKQVWDELESKDPRAAVRIARLAKTRAEVDRLVGIIKKYR